MWCIQRVLSRHRPREWGDLEILDIASCSIGGTCHGDGRFSPSQRCRWTAFKHHILRGGWLTDHVHGRGVVIGSTRIPSMVLVQIGIGDSIQFSDGSNVDGARSIALMGHLLCLGHHVIIVRHEIVVGHLVAVRVKMGPVVVHLVVPLLVRASQHIEVGTIVVVIHIHIHIRTVHVSGDRRWPHCRWRSRSLPDSASRRCIDLTASHKVARKTLRAMTLLNIT